MRIKCISNTETTLSSDLTFEKSNSEIAHKFSLKIGKEYIVYAMTIDDEYVGYFICNENFTYYPRMQPCHLFEIVDNRLSKYWQFDYSRQDDFYYSRTLWAFPEWCQDKGYYDMLIDAEEKEIEIFEKYRRLMDLEFPDPSILDTAEKIDEEWLFCQFCIDAWQPNSKVGMVICPKCNKTLHNPLYSAGT